MTFSQTRPKYTSEQTLRSGRTTRVNKAFKDYFLEKKAAQTGNNKGHFGRFFESEIDIDIISDVKTIEQASLIPQSETVAGSLRQGSFPEGPLTPLKTPSQSTETSTLSLAEASTPISLEWSPLKSFSGLFRSTSQQAFPSPSAPLRERFQKIPGNMNSSKEQFETLEKTPGGSKLRLRTLTPRHRIFKRSFKARITLQTPTGETKTIESQFYQSEDSARDDKPYQPTLPPSALSTIREKTPRPVSASYQIKKRKVTTESIAQDKGPRIYGHNGSASLISESHDYPVTSEHSHAMQDSLGKEFARAVLSDEDKAKGVQEDAKSSFPGARTHNSMLLATREIPAVRRFIEFHGALFYSDEISLYLDKEGPIPVIKSEQSSWSDNKGNTLSFIYDASYGVRPHAKLREYSRQMFGFALGSPPKKPKDDDNKEKMSGQKRKNI